MKKSCLNAPEEYFAIEKAQRELQCSNEGAGTTNRCGKFRPHFAERGELIMTCDFTFQELEPRILESCENLKELLLENDKGELY